jgi:hypothetical protein
MGPLGDDKGERPMKGRRRTEQDNGDEDDGTHNARDDTGGGGDRTNEGTIVGTRTRGQQQRGQGDSNGNDEDDPSTRPLLSSSLLQPTVQSP